MKILNIGCGKNKEENSIGIDISPYTDADVIHDLNIFPYPFSDNEFDRVVCRDVLEHLDNIVKVMEEIYRICRPGAEVYIRVPHFSSTHAYGDFTHRHFFNSESFDYFTGNFPQYDFYSSARFDELKMKINFWRLHRINGFSFLANRFPSLYEKYFAFIFPAMNIEIALKVIK